MSWKSLVTAGLLCVLASPVFAAPSLSITNGGLDASGNWIWNVTITPSAAGTPLATELGFTSTNGLVNVANADAATWDTNTAGNSIFGWETTYNAPAKPEGIEVNCTGCTVTNTAPNPTTNGHPSTVVNGVLNQIFAALGSVDLGGGGATQYLTIKTAGPTNTAATASMTLSGSYSGKGRIAEVSGVTSVNYGNYSGAASRTVVAGDANLSDGVLGTTPAVTGADLAILAANLGQAGAKGWGQGDFNGSTGGVGEVSGADLAILAATLGKTNVAGSTSNLTVVGSGAGLGAGSAVPEPASIALIGLAVLGGLGLCGRKR